MTFPANSFQIRPESIFCNYFSNRNFLNPKL